MRLVFFFLLGAILGHAEPPQKASLLTESWFSPEHREHWQLLSPLLSGWEGAQLALDAGEALTAVRWDGPLPEGDYELEVEARKVSGSDFFCALTAPVPGRDSSITFIVGGWGGQVVGLSRLDELDAAHNETTSRRDFPTGQWHHLRLRLTTSAVTAWIDGEQVLHAPLAGRRVNLRPGPIESCAPLGLATWQTGAELRHFRYRPLPATPSPPQR